MIGLSACFNNLKAGPRATTNSICKIIKKNNVSIFNTTIYINKLNRRVVVPCGMLNYKKELEELVNSMPIEKAIQILIKKYNIPLPSIQRPQQQINRYVYTTADSKVEYPVIQFNTSYRLGKIVPSILDHSHPEEFIVSKTYVLNVCNDDTKTFSNTISDMKVNATYWLSKLQLPCYCIIRPTNGLRKQIITGEMHRFDNYILFTAIIYKPLYFFYEEYPEKTNITILYQTDHIDVSKIVNLQNYYAETLNYKNNCS